MTPAELRKIGPALFDEADRWRWQTLLAEEIGVAPATVRRWLTPNPETRHKISESYARHIRLLVSLRNE